jgi:hypothetical protein
MPKNHKFYSWNNDNGRDNLGAWIGGIDILDEVNPAVYICVVILRVRGEQR